MDESRYNLGLTPPTDNSMTRTLDPILYIESNNLQWVGNTAALDQLESSFSAETSGDQKQFLDLGCGTGDFTRDGLLPRSLPCRRIVAVDLSQDMIDYARKHFSHPKICYDVLDVAEDVSALVQRYGHFDRVYSFFVLHFVKDKEMAFKNIARLMNPGGECLLLFSARSIAMQLLREVGKTERWKAYSEVCQRLVPDTVDLEENDIRTYVLALLKAANLKLYTCKITTESTREVVSDDLIRFHLSVCPIMPLLTEEEKPLFTEDIANLLRKWFEKDDADTSRMRTELVLVHASKPSA